MMKVVLITGSPHKRGTTALMAEHFMKGAQEAGHEVYRFDAAFKDVHPCTACDICRTADRSCIFKDDMEELNPHLLAADAIVFISPIYFYGITAQIKTTIDRFYTIDEQIQGSKKSALLLALTDDNPKVIDGAVGTYKRMIDYLMWENAGVIAAIGCATAEDIEKTDYLQKAYELGKTI